MATSTSTKATTDWDTDTEFDSALFSIIQELGTELHLRTTILQNLSLQTSIDTDLGLDSLSRMELLSRIERKFGVQLPHEHIIKIASIKDLKNVVLQSASGEKRKLIKTVSDLSLHAVSTTPFNSETLIDVLHWHLQEHPQRPHIKLYNETQEGEVITYLDLYQGASSIASGLINHGLAAGSTVAIMLPTGREYFYSFLGVLLAGGIPVPLYPPARIDQIEDHLVRHSAIVDNCQAKVLITFDRAKQVARLLKAHVASLNHIFTAEDLSHTPVNREFPVAHGQDIAFLQYTSGSTGQPKGVVLTHQNLLSNIRAMGEWMQVDARDVIVSWLPLYHDMGLIGCWLGSLYYSCLFVVMSPLEFIVRPERWLWAIHRYRGSISAAPNFAYELCLKRIKADYINGLDLSCWRAALNGAEAVSANTLQRFTERFRAYGFKEQSFMPVYGLAENCVGLSFPPMGRAPVIDRIQRGTFSSNGKAVALTTPETDALEFVACGRPLRQNEIRVVDELGKELGERQEGRILFRSPSMTQGYFRNPEQTQKIIHDSWCDTGDTGYMANGDIYITGRIKDIIVHAGRNLYPQELEEAVGEIEGVRKGCVAVFGAKDESKATEKLVVLAETRIEDEATRKQLHDAIIHKTVDIIGSPPNDVILAPPHSVLKTSSGKVRRSASRDNYENHRDQLQPHGVLAQISYLLISSTRPIAKRLLRLSRSFLYATWFWFIFVLFFPMVWLTLMLLPKNSWRWKVIPIFGKVIAALLGIGYQVTGLENLPASNEARIYVANHSSYLDVFVLLTCIPRRIHFVAKGELKRTWFFRALLQRIDVEFVDRDEKQQSLEDASHLVATAKDHESLFFFPEGTFSRAAGVYPFRMGAFVTAVQTKTPMIPVAIKGTRSILRPEAWFPRHGNVEVMIGNSLKIDDKLPQTEWEAAMTLRDKSREFILQHCGEADFSQEIRIRPNANTNSSA